MKKLRNVSLGCMIPALLALGIHAWLTPLPDWAVRIAGIVTVIAMFTLVFSTVRLIRNK